MERKIVHVVGTGTIGEPLIGLLCDYENKLGIDEVTFYKNSALKNDRSKVFDLIFSVIRYPACTSGSSKSSTRLRLASKILPGRFIVVFIPSGTIKITFFPSNNLSLSNLREVFEKSASQAGPVTLFICSKRLFPISTCLTSGKISAV